MFVGEIIKKRRRELGMSQAALARKLKTTKQAVYNWEAGKNLPDVTRFADIAKVLEIPVAQLHSKSADTNIERVLKIIDSWENEEKVPCPIDGDPKEILDALKKIIDDLYEKFISSLTINGWEMLESIGQDAVLFIGELKNAARHYKEANSIYNEHIFSDDIKVELERSSFGDLVELVRKELERSESVFGRHFFVTLDF